MSFIIYKPFGAVPSKEVLTKLYDEFKWKKLSWIHREAEKEEFKKELLKDVVATTFEHILGKDSEVVLYISTWNKADLIMPPYELSEDSFYISSDDYEGIKTQETTGDNGAFLYENILSLVSAETATTILKEMADASPKLILFFVENKTQLKIVSTDGYKAMPEKDGIKFSNLEFLEEKKTNWPKPNTPVGRGYIPQIGYSPQNVVPKGVKRDVKGGKFTVYQREAVIASILLEAGGFIASSKSKSKIQTVAETFLEEQDDDYLENILECYGLNVSI